MVKQSPMSSGYKKERSHKKPRLNSGINDICGPLMISTLLYKNVIIYFSVNDKRQNFAQSFNLLRNECSVSNNSVSIV